MKASLPFLASILCTSVALAESPPVQVPAPNQAPAPAPAEAEAHKPADTAKPSADAAKALVEKKVVAPLQKAESRRSKFSRAMPVPVTRRVRVIDTTPQVDARGAEFVRFAVDERRRDWVADRVQGCVYVKTGKVFVQRGDDFKAPRVLRGKKARAQPVVCRAAQA